MPEITPSLAKLRQKTEYALRYLVPLAQPVEAFNIIPENQNGLWTHHDQGQTTLVLRYAGLTPARPYVQIMQSILPSLLVVNVFRHVEFQATEMYEVLYKSNTDTVQLSNFLEPDSVVSAKALPEQSLIILIEELEWLIRLYQLQRSYDWNKPLVTASNEVETQGWVLQEAATGAIYVVVQGYNGKVKESLHDFVKLEDACQWMQATMRLFPTD